MGRYNHIIVGNVLQKMLFSGKQSTKSQYNVTKRDKL